MKIAWVHKLLGKHSRKFYGILAGILTAAVAGSGVGYHVIAASGTADQTEEDTQIDETDGQEDGSFSGTGTTQVKTESQLPDFSVNAVTMMVEEVYVEAGSTVAEGDALFKIDDESMADAKAYYEDAISDAETALQSAKIDFESGVLEAESANSALQLANQTFQKAVEEYNTKVTEANEKIAELTDELEELSDACDEAERNETTAQPALLQQYEEAVLEGKYADTEYEASLETLQSAVDEAQDTLDELKEQQSALLAIEDGVVCADRDGTLASVTYEAGDTLIKNTAFASYYDLDTILISVEVSQNDIAKLAVGDTVQVQISGSRMGAIDGTVYSIASEKTSGGSMSNVTYAVIVAVDNTDGTLTTGVQATVKFETQATGATEMEETKTAGKTETIGASETEEAGGKTE